MVQILLKYHYGGAYPTWESCAAVEGESNAIAHFCELSKLLREGEYCILLDGMNELPSSLQDALAEELQWLCEAVNLRIVITGRTVPPYPVFADFQITELCGIPEAALHEIVPETANHRHLSELLRLPLFLQIYQQNKTPDALCTRGELLDSYVMHLNISPCFDGKTARFLIRYALPFAAKRMTDCEAFTIDRADLQAAITDAFTIYLQNDRIYQNCIAPQKLRQAAVPDAVGCAELLLESACLISADGQQVTFTHQYFRDYFAALYVLNAAEALCTAYPEELADEQTEMLRRFSLHDIWFDGVGSREIYRLIGEICRDVRNIPTPDEPFDYHETLLDRLLDISRQAHTLRLTENVIRTMDIARNGVICCADFSRCTLPLYLPCHLKFSLNGAYPSSFYGCQMVAGIHVYETAPQVTAVSPNGDHLLIGLADGYAVLLSLREKALLCGCNISQYIEDFESFKAAAFSDDGSRVILLTECTRLEIEAATGAILHHAPRDFTEEPEELPPDLTLVPDDVYTLLPHYKNCDFRDADFTIFPYNQEILRRMGALTEWSEQDISFLHQLLHP